MQVSMMKNWGGLLLALVVLSGCSPKNASVKAGPGPNPILVATGATGVTGPRMRSHSSLSPERLEESFQLLINDPEPEKRYLAYLERVKGIYFRAQAYLDRFDSELDAKQPDILQGRTYKKLIVLRQVGERAREKMVYHYLRLLDIRRSKTETPERVALAKRITRAFHQALKEASEADRIAADDLVREIAEAVEEYRDQEDAENVTPYGSVREASQAFQRSREQIRQRSREELQKEREDSEDLIVSEMGESIFSEPIEIPQTGTGLLGPGEADGGLRIEPSVGPKGNITGSAFPKGTWALTYDDGPSSKHTPAILNNLKKLEKKATFFWLAQNVQALKSIVSDVQQAEMSLANHSYTHANLPKLGAEGLVKEILDATRLEAEIYGVKPKFFRCPYGAGVSVPAIRKLIADEGMIHVFWNVDTLDWQDKNPASIVERAKKQMASSPGGVILFHDIHPQSVEASRMLLEWSDSLKDSPGALRWVTLPEIVDELNRQP